MNGKNASGTKAAKEKKKLSNNWIIHRNSLALTAFFIHMEHSLILFNLVESSYKMQKIQFYIKRKWLQIQN